MDTTNTETALTHIKIDPVGLRFMRLPLDLQLSILKFLPKTNLEILLTEVPCLYDTLIMNKSLWETIELDGMAITTSRACKLITKAPYYTKVIISNRSDLNKLMKILIRSPRTSYITSLTFVGCNGSASPYKPLVKGLLVYKLLQCCPSLSSFELRSNRMKSLLLYQYLGKNCLNFKFLYSSLEKSELDQFLSSAPVSNLVLMEDNLVSGFDLVLHATEVFPYYGTFRMNVVMDKYVISFSSENVLPEVLADSE